MKIDQLTGTNNTQQTRATDRSGTADRTAGTGSATSSSAAGASGPGARVDTVFISGRAETLAKLATLIAGLPDIRQERVSSLQQQISSGSFHPSASDIASSLIQDEVRPS